MRERSTKFAFPQMPFRRCLHLIGILTAFPLPATNAFAAFTVSGRSILHKQTLFQVRGVDYQPTPISDNPAQFPPHGDYFTTNYSPIFSRDLPLLRALGANTIRVYGWNSNADHSAFFDACYNGGVDSLFVLVNRWIDPATDWSDASAVASIRREFLKLEANLKKHPAVLAIVVGNEANIQNENGDNPAFWAAINSIGSALKKQNPERLVSTAITDAVPQVSRFDPVMTSIDFWSVQVYRGVTFGTFFAEYEQASSRPLIVTEFGLDAFDQTSGQPYPDDAAFIGTAVGALWDEVAANATICAGACVFEFSDEWWKSPGGDSSVHDAGGFKFPSAPDGYFNEEWWGLFAIEKNGSSPDLLSPRAAFRSLQIRWSRATADQSRNFLKEHPQE